MSYKELHIPIDVDLKNDVDEVLLKQGLSDVDVITMLYEAISRCGYIPPFVTRIPNAETVEAMEDAKNRRNLTRYESIEELFREIEQDD